MRSRLKPLKKCVKTVRRHQDLMMNGFKAKKAYSSGAVEGLNRKMNLLTRHEQNFQKKTMERRLANQMTYTTRSHSNFHSLLIQKQKMPLYK